MESTDYVAKNTSDFEHKFNKVLKKHFYILKIKE